MGKDILVTTTNSLEGYRVTTYLQPITTNVVFGVNFFKDIFASFADVFGGQSKVYQKELGELYETAIEQIKALAREAGANAVLGLKIDFDEISGQGKQMFMLNAIGTAVVVKTVKALESEAEEYQAQKEKSVTIFTFLQEHPEVAQKAENHKNVYGEEAYRQFVRDHAKQLHVFLSEDFDK